MPRLLKAMTTSPGWQPRRDDGSPRLWVFSDPESQPLITYEPVLYETPSERATSLLVGIGLLLVCIGLHRPSVSRRRAWGNRGLQGSTSGSA